MAVEILIPLKGVDMAGTITVRSADQEMAQQIRWIYIRRLELLGAQLTAKIQRELGQSGLSGPSMPGKPPKLITGRLRNSIFHDVNQSLLSLLVGTNLKYGLYLEFGTSGGQKIVPKTARVLRWRNRQTGAVHYARKVIRGPIAARPFLRSTFVKQVRLIKKIMEAKIPALKGLP